MPRGTSSGVLEFGIFRRPERRTRSPVAEVARHTSPRSYPRQVDASAPRVDVDLMLFGDGVDPEQVDEATRTLRSELLDLDVEDVRAGKGGAAPSGTRGVDAEAIGQLVVGIGPSLLALRQLVETVRGWRSNRRELKISVRIGEDHIELTDASPETESRLVEEFPRRQSTA